MLSPSMAHRRGAGFSFSGCGTYLAYSALISAAVASFVAAGSLLNMQAVAGWVALLALGVLLVVEQDRRRVARTARQQRAHGSRYSAEFVALAESSQDSIFVLEALRNSNEEISEFALRYANSNALALLKTSIDAVAGANMSTLMPFFANYGFMGKFSNIVDTGRTETGEFAVDDARVNAKWLRLAASRFEDGILLTATDLTESKRLEVQLCQRAQSDALTGLPNRSLLDDRLQQALERAKRNRSAAAVLMLDLDNFKHINDTHGHAAGDHVLKVVAGRLREAVRATDSVFRIGGDEFVVLFTDVPTHGPVADFARKIVVSLFAPVAWHGRQLDVSASVGVAMYPHAGSTPETLLVQADIEMYRMKRAHAARALPAITTVPADFSNFAFGYH